METVKEQKAFYSEYPESKASKCIKYMAKNLISKKPAEELMHDMPTFWNNCFNYLKGNLLINDTNLEDNEKENIFSVEEENNIPDKKNEKADNNLEISKPDRLMDLMQSLIKSVDKVSEEIREMNSRLKVDSNVLVGGGQKIISSNFSDNKPGFSFDYEEYIQKRSEG